MTKSELIAHLAAQHPHLRQDDIEAVVGTVFREITDTLARGGRVELRGFGAFTTRWRQPRQGRNPRTGEAVAVGGKGMPHFKPGKELRIRINGGRDPGSEE
ncbi:MAG: integration host factor subunit beta [Acetobacteraceae bacterium]|nr:integration host factor subunit beta [Acetobacteraceae bacterium]